MPTARNIIPSPNTSSFLPWFAPFPSAAPPTPNSAAPSPAFACSQARFCSEFIAAKKKFAGLEVVARGEHGETRAADRAGHSFFAATLFQPQLSSGPQKPHPLLTAFLRAAAE